MKSTASIRLSIIIAVLVFLAGSIAAANVGRIKGTVTDYKTSEPIGGVSVIIDGTAWGAKTDFDGKFVILSVPPGTYNLNFTALGCKKVQMTDVEVVADQTTERNIQLESTIVDTSGITVVKGKRGKYDPNIHSGGPCIIGEIKAAPVATVDDLLNHPCSPRTEGPQYPDTTPRLDIAKEPNPQFGKIKGIVTDVKTKEPIGGVTVTIDSTTLRARTDFDGNFVIMHVPPGTYSLTIKAMGFKTIKITDVLVIEDSTSECAIQLEMTISIQGSIGICAPVMTNKEIQVKGRPAVKPTPVATVDELLSKETGITKDANGKIHVRGGRAGETCRIVDGVSFSDPLGFPPAHGGTNIVNDEAFDAMFFKNYGVNPFVDTEDDHLSTFASDVDDASFVLTRSYLDRNVLPPTEAVRTEEFINHFDYDYTAPYDRTFSVHIEGAPSKFGQNCSLLRIGLKGRVIPDEHRKPANLIFVIDISGSMDRENRLGLVKRSLYELLDQLNEQDKVGIVVYGNVGRIILEPTSVRFRHDIERKIDELQSNGSTNAEEGITLGYDMAHRHFEEGKINRVILCSDGVANVGRSGPDAILELIKKYADEGITLSTIGFGMGNYNDVLMEKLGNKGNGMYAYVDDITEARRIFKDNLTGNLQVIARDVKIQVDFNPNIVRSYRLLGYENRDVADDKFRDDKEDGGEVGAGHTVTALYEVKFHNHYAQRFFGTVYIRYKDPETFAVTEFSENMTFDDFNRRFEDATPDFRLAAAAAEFAEILRKSYWAKDGDLEDVFNLVREIDREKDDNAISEFKDLIRKARSFENELSQK
ncbi:MAG: von Willebrand factor type A domain-containing protein [Candidatus Zixiibacteriota bacterium]